MNRVLADIKFYEGPATGMGYKKLGTETPLTQRHNNFLPSAIFWFNCGENELLLPAVDAAYLQRTQENCWYNLFLAAENEELSSTVLNDNQKQP